MFLWQAAWYEDNLSHKGRKNKSTKWKKKTQPQETINILLEKISYMNFKNSQFILSQTGK